MKNKIAVWVMCLAVVFSAAIPVDAYTKVSEDTLACEGFEPFLVNISRFFVTMSIDNGNADMSGTLIANAGTQSITVNARLDRDNRDGTFTHVITFGNLRANGSVWTWDRTHVVARGHYYRLTLTATVVGNGITEVASIDRTVRAH